MQRLLQYHVVPGIILSDDVTDGEMYATVEGQMLTLTSEAAQRPNEEATYFINDAEILDGDILVSNGVIHGKAERLSFPLVQLC